MVRRRAGADSALGEDPGDDGVAGELTGHLPGYRRTGRKGLGGAIFAERGRRRGRPGWSEEQTMSNRPMGFGPAGPDDDGDREDDDRDAGRDDSLGLGGFGGADPFSAMFAGGDPEAMAQALRAAGAGDVDADQVRAMMGQVQRMLSTPGDGGPVNWQLAGEIARQVVSEHGDSSVSQAEQRAV